MKMKKKKVNKIPRKTGEQKHGEELKNTEKSLEKLLENSKNYHNRDDQDYKEIRHIENLFNKIDENHYKPIKAESAFNNNYKEYESKWDKDKHLSPENYLDIIRPYLRDMINNHKALIKYPNSIIIEDDLCGECKI